MTIRLQFQTENAAIIFFFLILHGSVSGQRVITIGFGGRPLHLRRPRRDDRIILILLFNVRHLPIIVVIAIDLLEFLIIGLLRPDNALQALLGQRVDDAAIGLKISLDLTLHPHHESRVHPHIVVFGTTDLVRHLDLRRGATNVRFG